MWSLWSNKPWKQKSPTLRVGLLLILLGGASRSRTDLPGFAIRCMTVSLSRHRQKRERIFLSHFCETGAGEESRTLDLNLGKVALYQLSYSRMETASGHMLPIFGAGEESRTLDLNLGKVALYQLSYSRVLLLCVLHQRGRIIQMRCVCVKRVSEDFCLCFGVFVSISAKSMGSMRWLCMLRLPYSNVDQGFWSGV